MPNRRKRDGERMRDAGRSQPRDPSEHIDAETPGAAFLGGVVTPPAGNPDWHPIALAWFESLKTSGQSIFYEPSDWATALLLAESISRDLNPVFVRYEEEWVVTDDEGGGHMEKNAVYERTTMRGSSLSAYLSAMGKLLVLEGDRRTFRVEVDRPRPGDIEEGEDAKVLTLVSSRAELLGDDAETGS